MEAHKAATVYVGSRTYIGTWCRWRLVEFDDKGGAGGEWRVVRQRRVKVMFQISPQMGTGTFPVWLVSTSRHDSRSINTISIVRSKVETLRVRSDRTEIEGYRDTIASASAPLLIPSRTTSTRRHLASNPRAMVHRAMKFTPQVLLSAPRRSAGVPNAAGNKVLFTTSTYSFSSHEKETELRVLDVGTGESNRLAHNDDISDLNWLDDDEFICLQAEKDGTTSLYWASIKGCEKGVKLGTSHYVIGNIDAGAANLKVVQLDSKGKDFGLVVSAQASPDGSLYTTQKAKKTTQSTGRLYDSLYVRHWDTWMTKERNALWYGKISKDAKDGKWKMSALTNALKDTGLACPIEPFGGTDNFDIYAGGIVFVAKDPQLDPALNTKCNVYLIKVQDWTGKGERERNLFQVVIPGFEGASTSPVCSRDGKKAAFLSMKKNGYEADKNQVFVLPDLAAEKLEATRAFSVGDSNYEGHWDRSPGSICFSADGKSLLVTAEEMGYNKLFILGADLADEADPVALTKTGTVTDVKPLPSGQIFLSGSSLVDNSWYAMLNPSPSEPPTTSDAFISPLATWTHSNSSAGTKFNLSPSQVSSTWTPSSNPSINKEVHSLVVKPSYFSPEKTYPVAYLIHGGPQGAWNDSWSTRWNPAVFAEQGYIVVAPNPTGSTGYGQAFCDAIRNNWGGDPYQDIVNVFNWVGQEGNLPGADNERAVALGASYGGYMVNWIQGHDLGRKLKALVCHDGILSTAGMLATEELYFPFHDMGGTAWYDPGFKSKPSSSSAAAQAKKNFGAKTLADWRKWSPDEHFSEWATPELVIHSEKDYRITIADGLAAFNVLQARGVESQLLTFPDENHWVLKPENSLVWHKVRSLPYCLWKLREEPADEMCRSC